MIYFQFLLGFFVYVGLASASYSKTFQTSRWFFPAGIAAAVVSNLVGLCIARTEENPTQLTLIGLYWDTMLTMAYLLVPILFFGTKLSQLQVLGLLFILFGIVLTKL